MPRKLIIDTDCGVDDAFAIMLSLHSSSQVEVVGVTCANGNATLSDVLKNVSRVLTASKSDVPFFSGARQPLVGSHELPRWPGHGADGLGDTDIAPDENKKPEKENAANAIVRLVNQSPGEVSIMLLGPMTNLALALQLDENVAKNLDEVVFMGGTVGGKGNASRAAEFNFLCDPESAHIVLDEITTAAVMVSWELTVENGLSWEWYDQNVKNGTSPLAQFGRKITKVYEDLVRHDKDGMELGSFVICDVIAAAVFVDPSIIKATTSKHGSVELSGKMSRGHLVIDWYDRDDTVGGLNLKIVDSIDHAKFEKMLTDMLK
eukprot:GFYU01012965.1.p1 GENE.GFYU01012965.1~~GFYU01012965.1.p1  ORF type:complete len:319 (-),score=72.58 GFYU01012965.1:17-973(-)